MKDFKTNFITTLFRLLERRDHLWLKAILPNPEETCGSSDIDLFVDEQDLEDILGFIREYEELADFQVIRKSNVVFLKMLFKDGSFLKVDLLTKLVRKQWTYLTREYLKENRIWNNNVATYTTTVLLEHVLFFNFLNHSGVPKKYVTYFSRMPDKEQQRLLSFINNKYNITFHSFEEMASYNRRVRAGLVKYLRCMPENQWKNRIKTGLDYLRSAVFGREEKGSKIVTFSGVDGAGKTTLLNDLKKVLSEYYCKKVVVLRHRPSLFPILSVWKDGRRAAEEKAASTLPRQGQNNSKLGSVLRFGYYFTDYIIGQIMVKWWYTMRGYTVIYDRYYFDFIVDPKRSNITMKEQLPKWLYRFITKPGLNIFLYATPKVILQRKKELPAEDIRYMTDRYQSLFKEFDRSYKGQYLCIENTDRTTSLHTILNHYSNNLRSTNYNLHSLPSNS